MNTLLLIKEIYLEGFRNLGAYIIRNLLKGYTWFSIALFAIALYAIIYRLTTGFAFD